MQLVESYEAAKAPVVAGGADDRGDFIEDGGVEEGEIRMDEMELKGAGPVSWLILRQQCISSNGRDFHI